VCGISIQGNVVVWLRECPPGHASRSCLLQLWLDSVATLKERVGVSSARVEVGVADEGDGQIELRDAVLVLAVELVDVAEGVDVGEVGHESHWRRVNDHPDQRREARVCIKVAAPTAESLFARNN